MITTCYKLCDVVSHVHTHTTHLFVLFSHFLRYCEITKCLCDEITQSQWGRRCDTVLGYLLRLHERKDHLFPACGWPVVTETTANETTDKRGLLYSIQAALPLSEQSDLYITSLSDVSWSAYKNVEGSAVFRTGKSKILAEPQSSREISSLAPLSNTQIHYHGFDMKC